MEPVKPDYTGIDDLPPDFDSRPEDERGRLMAKRVRLLHVYGQRVWHSELTIVGNRNALTVLRDALDAALSSGKAKTTAMVSDGEGYEIEIEMDDRPWESPSWESRELPYTEPMCAGRPDPDWEIMQLKQALRQANAGLVKRGAKPVKVPSISDLA